jgi:hypothetical protein
LETTFSHLHWPLPRPVTLDIAESHLHLLTGVSPSFPVRSSTLQLQKQDPIRHIRTPHLYHVTITDSVWATPLSLAATNGISIDFFSSSYSDASLRTVRSPKPKRQGSIKRDLIRKSRGRRSHAPNPGLSQLATSFFTYQAESSTNRRLCTSFIFYYLLLSKIKSVRVQIKDIIPKSNLVYLIN